MPATTPIYLFPSPALGETADGPAALAALATRMEREMPVLRASAEDTKDLGGTGVGPGTVGLIHEKDFTIAALGWAEVDVSFGLGLTSATLSDYSLIAGQVTLWLNDTQVRNIRYHNYARTRLVTSALSGSVSLQGITNLNVKFRVSADPGSAPVTVFYDNMSCRQYGAPLAG